MHERLLGRELVAAVAQAAAAQGLKRVRRAQVAIGALRQIDPQTLDLCFRAAAPGSLAEGAELAIERPPAAAYCLNCRHQVAVPRRADACPVCGGFCLRFQGGDELRVLACEGD